jgi:hypothetical protein
VLRSHARALEDRTGQPRPLELGDDEPTDELEATDRALCCSSIPFGAVALKIRFCPSSLALLRRELRLARVLLPESRTRLRTRTVACSLGLWAAFRSIDLNGLGLRTSFARVRARCGPMGDGPGDLTVRSTAYRGRNHMRRLCSLAIVLGVVFAGIAWIKSPSGAPGASSIPRGSQVDAIATMSATQKLPSHQYDLY